MSLAIPKPAGADVRIAVLGAGITGLSAAWHLHRAGAAVTVFESSARVGGAIASVRSDGWLHETGPNSILEGSPDMAALLHGLGLGSRRIYAADAAKNRYVVRRGSLHAVPTSPIGLLRSRLFSAFAKLRLASEPFRRRGTGNDAETVAEFTVRRLGREFLDYAVDPFVGGVYAGDPTRLSVRHAFPKLLALENSHGSLLRGAIARRSTNAGPAGRLFSFPEGLAELPLTIAQALGPSLRLRFPVQSVRRDDGHWVIGFEQAGERREEPFSAVICALPGDRVAQLKFDGFAHAAGLSVLSEIEHPPVASVFTGFRREDVRHPLDGFGILAPRVEFCHVLGTLFSSTLFPGRAPSGHVAFTTFIGGVRQPELAQLDEPFLVKLAVAELNDWLGLRGEPVFSHVRKHARAIPQYNLGYDRFQNACAAAEAAAPGLFIGGNFRDGISLSACVASGHRLAAAALGRVTQPVAVPA